MIVIVREKREKGTDLYSRPQATLLPFNRLQLPDVLLISFSLRERHSFLCVPKEKNPPCGLRHTAKERAARPLRRPRTPRSGTGGAKTRCAQTVCPFDPVPHPAARLSGKGPHRPRTSTSPEPTPQHVGWGEERTPTTSFDRSHAPAWERSRDAPASINWVGWARHGGIVPANKTHLLSFLLTFRLLAGGHSFLCVLKEKNPPCGLRHTAKERAARLLRRPCSPESGTGGAKTRCAQTVCPFAPVPHPAARLSGKGPHRPRTSASSEPTPQRGRLVYHLPVFSP